jgi:predicted dehydrogenase
MRTIGLVGVNTYHAEAFTRIFNGSPDKGPGIEDARITHVWAGEHTERLAELESMLGPYDNHVADHRELIGAVDGVLVVDDTGLGARHAELATPFAEAGMPVFVDKPMTTDFADAVKLFDLAAQNNAPLMSCSALRFTVEQAAIQDKIDALGTISSVVSVGPGEWFNYGVHAVELVGTLSDARPRTVQRTALDEKDVAVVTYDSGLVAVIETLRDAAYVFNASVYGEKGHLSFDVNDGMGFYTNTMRAFVEMIGTRQPPVTREQTLNVLAILHAGDRSAETGTTVAIGDIMEYAR